MFESDTKFNREQKSQLLMRDDVKVGPSLWGGSLTQGRPL